MQKNGGKKKEWQEDKGQYWQATTGTLEGTLSGKLAKLQSKFSDLKARLFEALAPVAEKLIDLVSNKNKLQQRRNNTENHSGKTTVGCSPLLTALLNQSLGLSFTGSLSISSLV